MPATTSLAELRSRLSLPPPPPAAERAALDFPLRVPEEMLARIAVGEPDDPVLRQVEVRPEESQTAPAFVADPVDDLGAEAAPGVIHKYRGRALLVVTGACPVHCRYCFRRHFPYAEHSLTGDRLEAALDYLRRETTLREVILSGGDPLSLADERLAEIAERLAAIDHIERLRVHTRYPIAVPSRVGADLVAWLVGTRLSPVVVVHANHPNELDAATEAALRRLADAGIPLLNQAVLLRGVNDSAAGRAAPPQPPIPGPGGPHKHKHQHPRAGAPPQHGRGAQ
ncbi:MAG: KamA family radical SAM protein, partial [Thermoanaerobaculia bacterium]|nr:KamA family radical SAM protein [Thermoanaerobaculia bacterium]